MDAAAPTAAPASPPASAAGEGPAQCIELALISHTNAGKTTLARTLLGEDVGEVRDAPHVTDLATPHVLIETDAGDRLRLWDTPGFGDSARLVARLRHADDPLGWLLRELWDRHRDRALWSNQQAVRAARESADLLLYLVNAAEDPRDAGYIAAEMQVLRWIGKPVLALLNQLGPPRPAADERADVERWRDHLAQFGVVQRVLPLDAFARCWNQERVLLDALQPLLPAASQAAFARLRDAWQQRNDRRFVQSMQALAEQLQAAARDAEPVAAPAGGAQKLLHAIGLSDQRDAAREQAMAQLLTRLDAGIRASTDRLIALHALDGRAAQAVLARLRENFASATRLDPGRSALWSSLVTGALTGLKADLATGGLSFGAGTLVGGVLGGLAGAGAAEGFNRLSGRDRDLLRFAPAFLDGLLRSAVLRYLAVAHFGRGRGDYVESEAAPHWQSAVDQAFDAARARFEPLWKAAAAGTEIAAELQPALAALVTDVLNRLYPEAADARGPAR